MKLSTGKVAFPIEFDNGEKAVIYINPNDRGIQDRIKNFETVIMQRIEEIDAEKYREKIENGVDFQIDIQHPEKMLELSLDEIKALQEKVDAVNELENEYNQKIKEELDVVFGGKVSEVAFRHCQPFDMVLVDDGDGKETRQLYVMHFLQWLMVELTKYAQQNQEAMNSHLAKYSK